ncbi:MULTISPECIES: hypothetical protein [Streptomyces]|uniref:Uncharacterized protein n=1 Tax=Streptomyces viridochromogenes TaxID=1938 RepID=A0A0L8JIJ3_STRVR|nr:MULTISPECIES: hypothetical protein [Streptomyces]KOG13414.1 hypothetical protein ADK34_31040 [Streptomyces viridochromogenes]
MTTTPEPPTQPPTQPPTSAPTDDPPRRRRFSDAPAWISAATGVAGLLLGFLGLPVFVHSPTAAPKAAPTVVTTTPAAEPTTADVSAPPTTTTAAPPPSTTPTPTGNPSDVYKIHTVDLTQDYGFALDKLRPVSRDDQKEIYWYSSWLNTDTAQFVALDRKEPGNYETCSTVTRFTNQFSVWSNVGDRFCIIAPTGLIALAEVTGGGRDADFIRLKLTIWRGTY